MTLKRFFAIIISLSVLPLLTDCGSTKKKDKELTGVGRLYQNTTARFNGFFNGDELVQEAIESLEGRYRDDFSEVLPIYPYQVTGDVNSVSQNLDAAIDKATVVVALRRKSDWTDDCYLLVGKAQFLKQEYESAEETLRFMLAEYGEEALELQKIRREQQKKKKDKSKSSSKKDKDSKANKGKTEAEIQATEEKEERKKEEQKSREERRKELDKWRKKYNKAVRQRRKGKDVPLPKRPGSEEKEEEIQPEVVEESPIVASTENIPVTPPPPPPPPPKDKDEKYFLYRKPAWQEAKLWMARTLLQRDKKEEAMRYIRQLNSDGNTFPEVRREVPILEAYIHLENGKRAEAANALTRGIKLQTNKPKKARYTFILAQLYAKEGMYPQAAATFKDVLGLTNDFELEFNSKLNIALANWRGGSGSKEEIISDLEKMLKEDKYIDYQDQIYYTLASLALERGDRQAAIENLQKSLNASRRNPSQKANAYLTLADLYFEEENYVPAKSYYDSTLTVLPTADDDYQRVLLLSNNLTAIAEAITTIEYQDSLLKVSQLSESDRKKLAFQIQQERDEARLKGANVSNTNSVAAQQIAARRPTSANNNEPLFFAYDDRAQKRGMRDFQRKWGERQLEDNWRRSQRSGAELFDDETQEVEEIPETVFSEETIDEILKDIPNSPEEISVAQQKIQEAYFSLGALYRDNLEYYQKSIESLEKLLQRYPDTEFELDAWYLLYLNYLELKQSAKAEAIKNRIITKYPNTNYAKVLQNPNYAKELLEQELKINRFYAKAYQRFESGNAQEAHKMCLEAANTFDAEHPLQSKFILLDAFAVGKLEGEVAYKQALQKVSSAYPNSDEAKQAREMLRLLGGAVASLPGGKEIDLGQFRPEKEAVHYVLVALNPSVNVNIVNQIVTDFNNEFFKQSRLRTAPIYLGPDPNSRRPIIVVRRFKNEAEAIDYYQATIRNKEKFIGGSEYDVLPITQNNYRQVLRNKTVDGYKEFFQQMYLK